MAKAKTGGAAKEGDPKDDVKITLWKNGFQVGEDGPIREYDTPENKQFMQDLNNGRLPMELAKQFKRDIGIALSDRRKEMYRPPTPPSYIAFSGAGQSLGGQMQAIAGAVDTTKSHGKPVVDTSKPFTTIQFRLHDGQRTTLDVNLDHRVSDLHTFVKTIAPVKGTYQLMVGFPPKALSNPSATIEEAGLIKASITQKLC